MTIPRYYVGLDLGQAADYTALAIVEQRTVDGRMFYDVRHLKRWPVCTSYPAIARDVCRMIENDPLKGCMMAIDQTGVGRTIVDTFRQLESFADIRAITLTLGQTVHWNNRSQYVPKLELAGVMQTLLQTKRLRFAKRPETEELVKELQTFRVRPPAIRADDFDTWRDRAHDDLFLAVAMACWLGEKCPPAGKVMRFQNRRLTLQDRMQLGSTDQRGLWGVRV
jgi:hypothetical protein